MDAHWIHHLKGYGKCDIYYAAQKNKLEKAKEILADKDLKIQPNSYNGQVPLHVAAANGHCQMMELFLINGTDVDITTKFGSTPLHHAATRDRIEPVTLLLKWKANVNAQDVRGQTPFHIAAYRRCHDVVKILIMNGADPNIKDENGRTPSMLDDSCGTELLLARWEREHEFVELTRWNYSPIVKIMGYLVCIMLLVYYITMVIISY